MKLGVGGQPDVNEANEVDEHTGLPGTPGEPAVSAGVCHMILGEL